MNDTQIIEVKRNILDHNDRIAEAFRAERKAHKAEVALCKKSLRASFSRVRGCAYLKRKEKLVLLLARTSFGLARLAYLIKGGK